MAKILLAGLDTGTANEFSRKLALLGHATEVKPCDIDIVKSSSADVIFASGDDLRCSCCLKRLCSANGAVPVVVVSRLAEDDGWLSALEAGATDFCGADIDTANLRWVVENAISHPLTAVAAA